MIVAVALALSGCSLLRAATEKIVDTTGEPGPDNTTVSPTPVDPLKPMNDAYAAFTKELGENAAVSGVTWGVKKSIVWTSDLSAEAYVWQDGQLSRAKERLVGQVTTKTFPLNLYRPKDMLASLSKNGVCTKVVSTHVYWSGYRLIDATCSDAKGLRTVQVGSTSEEFPVVDLRTKEGMKQLWSELLMYGPATSQIQSYEYWFVSDGKGKQPGAYLSAGSLRVWRYASPQYGQILSEVITDPNLSGQPWLSYARYNATSFWTAYEATLAKCGTVDKLAVAFEGTAAPYTTVIVGTGGACTLTVESTRSKG